MDASAKVWGAVVLLLLVGAGLRISSSLGWSAVVPIGELELHSETLSQQNMPNALIGIGYQKCGSTYLFHLLKQHPKLIKGHKKELSFFLGNVTDLPTFLKQYGYSEKESEAEDWSDKYLIEFTPNYVTNPFAAQKIKAIFPHAKLVMVMREPVKRAWSLLRHVRRMCLIKLDLVCRNSSHPRLEDIPHCSAYREIFQLGKDDLDSMNMAGCTFQNGEMPSVDACMNRNASIWDVGKGFYAVHISYWLRYFPPEQLLILKSEDLYQNPLRVANQVLEFAGIGPKFGKGEGEVKLDESSGKYPGREIIVHEDNLKEFYDLLTATYQDSNQALYKQLDTLNKSIGEFPAPEFTWKNGKESCKKYLEHLNAKTAHRCAAMGHNFTLHI